MIFLIIKNNVVKECRLVKLRNLVLYLPSFTKLDERWKVIHWTVIKIKSIEYEKKCAVQIVDLKR